MDLLGKYVRRIGTVSPVGIVQEDTFSDGVTICKVYWGTADGRVYTDEIDGRDLEVVDKPVQPEEILLRQGLESGGRIEDV